MSKKEQFYGSQEQIIERYALTAGDENSIRVSATSVAEKAESRLDFFKVQTSRNRKIIKTLKNKFKMKTLVKEIAAYQFCELSETAKETVKQWYLEDDDRTMFFTENIVETLKEDFGLSNLKPYYSLSYCQGDGLCLFGQITHSELFGNDKLKKIALKNVHYKQVQSIYNELAKIDFTHRGRYYSANSVYIESHDYDPTDKQIAIIDKIIDNVKVWYFSVCNEWEKRGYEYFYEIPDDEMEDTCDTMDYYFTENGKFIHLNEYKEIA